MMKYSSRTTSLLSFFLAFFIKKTLYFMFDRYRDIVDLNRSILYFNILDWSLEPFPCIQDPPKQY